MPDNPILRYLYSEYIQNAKASNVKQKTLLTHRSYKIAFLFAPIVILTMVLSIYGSLTCDLLIPFLCRYSEYGVKPLSYIVVDK